MGDAYTESKCFNIFFVICFAFFLFFITSFSYLSYFAILQFLIARNTVHVPKLKRYVNIFSKMNTYSSDDILSTKIALIKIIYP